MLYFLLFISTGHLYLSPYNHIGASDQTTEYSHGTYNAYNLIQYRLRSLCTLLFYTYSCVDTFKHATVATHLPENFSSISNVYLTFIKK